MTPGSFEHVRSDPLEVCRWLRESGSVSGAAASVVLAVAALTVFEVVFDAPTTPQLRGYPAEEVRVTAFADRQVVTVPVGDPERSWRHRYPARISAVGSDWEIALGGLCLWYPMDPAHLQWHWRDGFDADLQVVQRHLWFEEYYRRRKKWPVEEAPHGESLDGRPHPILTPTLRRAS